MRQFLDHVAFSWLVGNGDLHAKNVSVLWEIEADRFGRAPSAVSLRYSPLYDLVNTRVVLPGDHFAIPLNGKKYNLKLRDFSELGARCGLDRSRCKERVIELGERVMDGVGAVLEASGLSEEGREVYRRMTFTILAVDDTDEIRED